MRVFLVGLGNWSEFFGCFIEKSSEIWRKIKYLPRKKQKTRPSLQRLCQMLGKNHNHPKISRDSVNLRLCDSRDHFLNLQVTALEYDRFFTEVVRYRVTFLWAQTEELKKRGCKLFQLLVIFDVYFLEWRTLIFLKKKKKSTDIAPRRFWVILRVH